MLPIQPQEASKIILKKLPTRRMKDVVEKRFGLKGGRKKTLDSIGQGYRITRERVRQIEADALKFLRKKEHQAEIDPIFKSLEECLDGHGGVMAKKELLTTLVKNKEYPHVSFLLSMGEPFHYFAETEKYYDRWALSKEKLETAERTVAGVVSALEESSRPVSYEVLAALASSHMREISGAELSGDAARAYLGISKLIQPNPYGEYGLSSWPMIRPHGVRDKAYTVLAKSGKPLHFREVAAAIDKVGWRTTPFSKRAGSKKRAHPQTVHNELIKDSRFTLVGRGLYALAEWGYEPGVVRDVLVSILKKEARPLSREEIVELVSAKRFVKPQTVLLNLQNRSLFKKTEEGKYTLV